MDSDGLHARLLRLRPRTVLNRPPLTLRGGLRASASVPVRPAALGERVQDSGCRRWDRGRQLAGHGTGHWLVARPLIDKARDERQVSRHDRHSPSPGCASCLRRPTSGGSICPAVRAAPLPARTCAAAFATARRRWRQARSRAPHASQRASEERDKRRTRTPHDGQSAGLHDYFMGCACYYIAIGSASSCAKRAARGLASGRMD